MDINISLTCKQGLVFTMPIQVMKFEQLSEHALRRLMQRAQTDITEVLTDAAEIIDRIRKEGDKALVELVNRLESPSETVEDLRVPPEEILRSGDHLDLEMKTALDLAYSQIRKFHDRQRPEELSLGDVGPGILAGEKTVAIPSVALYVPRGKGSFPSVALMLGVPAKVAGVKRTVLVTPGAREGGVDPACLYAAHLCGISEVYRMGGAHAIAALGLGTQSISPVSKILGPGGLYASAAKRLLYGQVDVGLPAGPSEAIILADEFADAQLVALDLLNEAEHGPDSAALLVTHSEALCGAVEIEIARLIQRLPERRREFVETGLNTYGGILVTSNQEQSIEFINEYAPEHLQLHVREPFAVLDEITNAGEVLLGSSTPIALANYVIGVNAILPTGRFARSYSPVSVRDFTKTMGVAYVTPSAFSRLAPAAVTLADYEGFPAHAMALRERIERV